MAAIWVLPRGEVFGTKENLKGSVRLSLKCYRFRADVKLHHRLLRMSTAFHQRSLAKKCAVLVSLSGVLLSLGGCETSATNPEATRPRTQIGVGESGAVPSANVSRLQAWKDANAVAARGTGRESLVGAGTSMSPIFGDNTMLVITPIDYSQLRAGMTVVYMNRHNRRVAHQLIAHEAKGWKAQGLNNPEEDNDYVTPENLIGVVYASMSAETKE